MRLVSRVLGIVLALGLVAAALILGPAHFQIRGIEPPLPLESELRALAEVPDGPVRVRYLTNATQVHSERGILGHEVFLIEWADGKLFMIDAGMDRAAAKEFAELLRTIMGGGEDTYHGSVPELLGEDVQRVAGVGFTHLHIDHTAGLKEFCAARGDGAALVQTRWQAEEHNLHTDEGAAIVANSCLRASQPLGDSLQTPEAFPGLGVVALGGHTPGSTLFAATVQGRLWLFSGDITNERARLLENRGKGFSYSYLMVPEHTGRTEELRGWLAELDSRADVSVAVSHDHVALETLGMERYSR